MPRKRNPQQVAAGKLVLAIQKVQSYRAGTSQWHEAGEVMGRAHELHQAAVAGRLAGALSGKTIAQYLGANWVACHPGVMSAIEVLETEI